MRRSKINPLIDINYIKTTPENVYFDVKSSRIKSKDLATHFSAFANAGGGVIVVGVSDNREFEGFINISIEDYNNIISAPKNCCSPMPNYDVEELEIINKEGKKDKIVIFHIETEINRIIRTTDNKTYLRIANKTKELRGEDLINLEYAKNRRKYEDEINEYATLEDLDFKLLEEYKEKISAKHLKVEEVLRARGFLVKEKGKNYLTNGALLLFAKNIFQFYPNCRVRFIRYEGNSMEVGTRMNVLKDQNIEDCILNIIPKAINFISTQLREFISLDKESGKFKTIPEYPEFAWTEGIVNAVTHREYSLQGIHIVVSMYDDRLEILSPGKLPSIVTLENIKETRYSRNSRIARVLTEFGWVRELNEGVKRIYEEMKIFFLDEPEYYETGESVKLVLKNNIVMRKLRQSIRLEEMVSEELWKTFDKIDKNILIYITGRGRTNRKEIEKEILKSTATVNRRLKRLIELGVIEKDIHNYIQMKIEK
ncbi:MAG: ATP-binding protein [Fusobacterium sp.]|uniref:ATP-binding protein n=1 Tax=Fusobacterium sp. TaxID=68766 RepID=UPI0026DC1A95|nr:ATP-binding protein [Fusobacterium sp.]MDO4689708.1 ATP-binding protein [Fusobacterium sp.]